MLLAKVIVKMLTTSTTNAILGFVASVADMRLPIVEQINLAILTFFASNLGAISFDAFQTWRQWHTYCLPPFQVKMLHNIANRCILRQIFLRSISYTLHTQSLIGLSQTFHVTCLNQLLLFESMSICLNNEHIFSIQNQND